MSIQLFEAGRAASGLLCLTLALAAPAPAAEAKPDAGKVPITTRSPVALSHYLEGRDLLEKLRATDAHAVLEKAVAEDKDFAMAHLALANSAPSAKDFFASLERAVALADRVSEGERLTILGTEAGVKSQPELQKERFQKLVATFPEDERAHNLLGGYYFGRQQYADAIAEYEKAIAINPAFSQPYNQLGYSQRFLGRYEEAEKAFKKYAELIPDDPNPYDSYAELLLKTGRFGESIAQYHKALAVDSHFVASYIGIGVNETLLGHPDKARASFEKLGEVARNSGERRAALAQQAWSWIDAGLHDKALASVRAMSAIAAKDQDQAALSADHNLTGNILLDAGKADEAAAQYAKAVETIGQANVPGPVKEATRRNALFNEARVALAKQDLAKARAKAADYAAQVALKEVPFEVWQSHYLAGLVALAEKDHAKAIAQLELANQQDPRVLYALALAYQAKGEVPRAKEYCKKAAEDNSLNFNYAYVRTKATKLLSSL
jgi:tetratricopeptide (TPR) repeat protein